MSYKSSGLMHYNTYVGYLVVCKSSGSIQCIHFVFWSTEPVDVVAVKLAVSLLVDANPTNYTLTSRAFVFSKHDDHLESTGRSRNSADDLLALFRPKSPLLDSWVAILCCGIIIMMLVILMLITIASFINKNLIWQTDASNLCALLLSIQYNPSF